MKKLSLLLAGALVSLGAMAHTINNPVGEDGRYIVKYDMNKHAFAASNNMEVDETFVLAVDVTGTWLEDWLKEAPVAEGASRGVAFNNWTSCGDTNGDFRRLKQIDGNIWGWTCNFAQAKADAADWTNALMKDSVLYVYGQLFGFEYTDDNPGAGWWMWGTQEVETTQADGADCFFTFAPYTGTHTSYVFYGDDFEQSIYGFGLAGYAAPEVDLGPVAGIHHTWFATTSNWVEEHDSYAEYDGHVLTIHNGQGHEARWQGQVFVNLFVDFVPGNTYTVTATIKAVADPTGAAAPAVGSVLMKVSDPEAGIGTDEKEVTAEGVQFQVSGVCPDNHSDQIVFDCGFAAAGSVIEVSDITIVEEVTGIESIKTVKATKLMENGQVVIIRDGVRYSVLGLVK